MGQTLLPGNQTAINAEMRGNFFDRQPTFMHKDLVRSKNSKQLVHNDFRRDAHLDRWDDP